MFETDGFLSPTFAATIVKLRDSHKNWFDLLDTGNRLAMEILPHLLPEKDDEQLVLAAALYAKAIQSVQAAILLGERGMTAEARTILRTSVEAAIFQRKVALDASFPKALVERHDYHRRKYANALLADNQAIRELSTDEIASLRSAIEEIRQEYGEKGPRDINVQAIAVSIDGLVLYNCFFRAMSNDAAHVTLQSLDRYVKRNERDEMLGLSFSPQENDLRKTLSETIGVLAFVLHAAVEDFKLSEYEARMMEYVRAWQNQS